LPLTRKTTPGRVERAIDTARSWAAGRITARWAGT
jgi:hypothetical protein